MTSNIECLFCPSSHKWIKSPIDNITHSSSLPLLKLPSMASSSISFFSSSLFSPSPKWGLKPHLKPHLPTSRVSPTRSELATLPILSFDGTETGTATLNLKSAPPETSRAVVHRGLITDLRNKRRGTASTLTRAEVRGGGKKPYPQKKTGRARRGSQTTPLRPGGGVVFGPKPRDWSIKMNKKEKRLAISTALSSAVESANAIVVEDINPEFSKPKTKEFVEMMKRLGLDPSEKAMFLMMEEEVNENVALSGRNIGTLKMLTPRTLNLFDILDSEKLVFTRGAVEFLNQRYGYEYESEGDEDVDEDEDEDEDDEGVEIQDG